VIIGATAAEANNESIKGKEKLRKISKSVGNIHTRDKTQLKSLRVVTQYVIYSERQAKPFISYSISTALN
jgi:hypothetical protein